jgi:hypothetical protein
MSAGRHVADAALAEVVARRCAAQQPVAVLPAALIDATGRPGRIAGVVFAGEAAVGAWMTRPRPRVDPEDRGSTCQASSGPIPMFDSETRAPRRPGAAEEVPHDVPERSGHGQRQIAPSNPASELPMMIAKTTAAG